MNLLILPAIGYPHHDDFGMNIDMPPDVETKEYHYKLLVLFVFSIKIEKEIEFLLCSGM